jgi:hypothetical protein
MFTIFFLIHPEARPGNETRNSFMIQVYAYRHEDLQTKYRTLHQELDEQISTAAQVFLNLVNVPSILIDLGLDSLFEGDFDPSLGRCRLRDAIFLGGDKVFVRIEGNDEFYSTTDFGILHVPDKLKILSAVEEQLREFL